LIDASAEPARPVAPADSLLFDLRAPAGDDDAAIAADRAAPIEGSVPFVAASHLVWGAILLTVLQGALDLGPLWLALAGIAAADLGLWFLLRAGKAPPHRKIAVAVLHGLVTGGLWSASLALLGAGAPAAAQAAILGALVTAVATCFAVPALLLVACLGVVAAVAFTGVDPALLGITGAAGVLIAFLSLSRARGSIASGRRRRAEARQSEKARRFVAEYEESGRGWFWETDAAGRITYLTSALVGHFGGEAAVRGRRLEDLLLVAPDEAGQAGRSLAFHLSARFPFADALVRAPGAEEVWWSVSGTPHFDDCGRFLGFRGLGANLSEQRRTEAEKARLASHDSLTGLPNRPTMRTMLDAALANAAERRQGCALMMIDLDRFKQVNDTFGHPVGDGLLREVAVRLGEVLGRDGQVGRLGGDEFEAILPGIAEESRLSDIAASLIETVSRPYEIEGHRVEVGASVGIAIARPGKSYASAMIRDADLALYAAKAAGRGTFRIFVPAMHEEAAERRILEADLREALARDQLRLHFQPTVASVSEEIVAFEALLRWQHPTRGLLLPATIVPLAEECGLMPRIGDWVLRTACAEAAHWPDHVRVAVNLSPTQFGDAALTAIVANALAASGVAPERLELEIAEAVFPAGGDGPERILHALKALGVRLALDNFGTGPSGLGNLRDAPLDKIKIHGGFVRGAAASGSRNAAIVRSIVVLAESLGMDTTAEGAETLEDLALVRSLGFSQVQGFLFGRPVPADEAAALAAASRPSEEAAGFTRPPRHRLIRTGTLHIGEEALPVRLRNISEGGAMIECPRSLDADTPVLLDLEEAGRLAADVRWCQRGQIGLRFAARFELGRLARPRPASGHAKMMMPRYLEAAPPGASAAAPGQRGGRGR
jgi:diguanylate cyclase (GGDEF)-like protein